MRVGQAEEDQDQSREPTSIEEELMMFLTGTHFLSEDDITADLQADLA